MTAANHALTGAAIGLIITQPAVAIPVALLSHFVCDAIPHFRSSLPEKQLFQANWFKKYLVAEAIIVFVILGIIASVQPANWLLAVVCASIAVAPDLLSMNRFFKVSNNKRWRPGAYVRFASRIQWFERPIGAVVEAAWFIAGVAILSSFLYP
jgi:hypothetical protein